MCNLRSRSAEGFHNIFKAYFFINELRKTFQKHLFDVAVPKKITAFSCISESYNVWRSHDYIDNQNIGFDRDIFYP